MCIRDRNIDVEEAKRYILQYVKSKHNHTIKWKRNNKTLEIVGLCKKIVMADVYKRQVQKVR